MRPRLSDAMRDNPDRAEIILMTRRARARRQMPIKCVYVLKSFAAQSPETESEQQRECRTFLVWTAALEFRMCIVRVVVVCVVCVVCFVVVVVVARTYQ